jgi:hypothetical protein
MVYGGTSNMVLTLILTTTSKMLWDNKTGLSKISLTAKTDDRLELNSLKKASGDWYHSMFSILSDGHWL